MGKTLRFRMQDEDHFARLFDLFDLLDEKEVTGKVRDVFLLLGDSLPSGGLFDAVGGTSEQVRLVGRRAWMTDEEIELFVEVIVESKGVSETQLNHVIHALERPVLMLEPDVEYPDAFEPRGLSPKMVLLLIAIRRTIREDRYFTRGEVFPAYLDLDPSGSYAHGFPTLLRRLAERGILTYNRFAANCIGAYLVDFNIRLTARFVRFLEEGDVKLEDLGRVEKKA